MYVMKWRRCLWLTGSPYCVADGLYGVNIKEYSENVSRHSSKDEYIYQPMRLGLDQVYWAVGERGGGGRRGREGGGLRERERGREGGREGRREGGRREGGRKGGRKLYIFIANLKAT